MLDQLKISFRLNDISCSDEGDGSGKAEPFLWVVYFKVDGDTVFVGDDLKLHGSATVVTTPGSHGNLSYGSDGVDAGDKIAIPSKLGRFDTTLKPIPTPLAGTTVGGMVGFLAILLEEDSTSDHDIQVGHAALNLAVQNGIDDILKTLGVAKQDITDEETEKLESSISSAVEKAISDEVDLFQGLWSYIGFGNGQDDKIGTAKFIGKHADMANAVGATNPLHWTWNNEGKWSLDGSVTVHKIAAAAIMRSGDWASRFLFGRSTKDFVAQNQRLFDRSGLRLLQMHTWLEDGVRRWSSIHRSGSWSHGLTVDRDTKTFVKETQDLFDNKGLRLEHMVSYVDGGVRRWAGSYRSGDWSHGFTVDRDGPTFVAETQDLFDQKGLRLEQVITYLNDTGRHWAGIYRSGTWGHRFTMDRDTTTFLKETQKWFDEEGLRLIDMERYVVNGQIKWAGVYRTGNWAHRLILDRGVESLVAETQEAFDASNLRLVCLQVYKL